MNDIEYTEPGYKLSSYYDGLLQHLQNVGQAQQDLPDVTKQITFAKQHFVHA
jgi:hypothetical protein